MQSTVLVLGARGRFGLAAARAFADAGWRVLAHMRPGGTVPAEAAHDARIEWLAMDLSATQALASRARGTTVLVNALSPSAYTNKAWAAEVLPMADQAIAVARALDATLMVPGNVYNFGDTMPGILREETPQLATTIKGRLRVAMEHKLQQSGVRSVVVRAGDFFGSGKGTWFDSTVVTKIAKGVFTYPGQRGVGTAWAYLPDLARTFVAVAEKRAQLQPFEVLHFAGHTLTGQQWLDVLDPIARQQGWVRPDAHVRLSGLPWSLIRVGAWFLATWAALLEMAYLWTTPHSLANDKLTRLIGHEPRTPLLVAAQAALTDLGYIAARPQHHTPRSQHAAT